MVNPVIMEGRTIEEAVFQALTALAIEKNEAKITILQQPSSNLFGFNKKKAIVRVERLILEQEESVLTEELPASAQEKPRRLAVVENGRFKVLDADEKQQPVIKLDPNLEVYINGQIIADETAVALDDEIEIQSTVETIPVRWRIELRENNTKAVLVFEPGEVISYSVQDHAPAPVICLQAVMEKRFVNDLTPEKIMSALEKKRITFGVNHENIMAAVKLLEPGELELAQGIPPEEGENGTLDFHVNYKAGLIPPKVNYQGTADFREIRMIPQVKAGELLATVIHPKAGQHGKTVTGEELVARTVKEVTIRHGKGVVRKEDQLYATEAGRLHVEPRGLTYKVEVLGRLIHEGDVDITTGNVKFQGDVEVRGNVQEMMKVEAAGDIEIMGQVTGASLFSNKSTIIKKNIFSTTVTSGNTNSAMEELLIELKNVLVPLEGLFSSIEKIINQLEKENKNLPNEQETVNLLINSKFQQLPGQVKKFVREASKNQLFLQKDWVELANQMFRFFFMQNGKEQKFSDIKKLAHNARMLFNFYATPADEQTFITVPYAIKSHMYSSGDILVTGQGVYNSTLKARNAIKISGYIKGGEVEANSLVDVKVAGSDTGVKTFIKVDAGGEILLETACPDTTIQVGKRRHTFYKETRYVKAHLDEDGELALH